MRRQIVRRRHLAATCLAGLLGLLVPAAALAHPLGNFTINHYTGIRVQPDAVLLDHVLDMAEIPAFQERQRIDADRDGTISDAEATAYRVAACETTAEQLNLSAGAARLPLELIAAGLAFPPGQGGLVTLRLVCEYRATLGTALASGTAIAFVDPTYAERIGWREIVVEGDGVTVSAPSRPTGPPGPPGPAPQSSNVTGRLTSYPASLLSTPLDERDVTFTASPGGPRLPPLRTPDALSLRGPQPAGLTSGRLSVGATPGGSTDIGGDLTALVQARDLTPSLVLLALLLAAGLGALHAVTPGHGKTVMAAYLVGSRGGARHALGLGLIVTLSHTMGILVLGALTVFAATLVSPERLYPVLGLASGLLVLGIGAGLLAQRGRELWSARRAGHAGSGTDQHRNGAASHDHDDVAHGHGGVAHSRGGTAHSHGGAAHSHLPPDAGGPLRWRGLFALGLAGGLVPSASALLLLLGSVTLGRPAFGLLLTVAFGIGMASVLVSVGLLLVYARGLLERLPTRARMARLGRALPLATAAVVLAFGVMITAQAVSQVRF